MTPQVVLITGATDGIGLALAKSLAQQDYEVILHGRQLKKGAQIMEALMARETRGKVTYVNADFADLEAVRTLGRTLQEKLDHLDILVNNAGTIQPERTLTQDGHETTFGVNHLAPFLLTLELIPLLLQAPKAHIINVSSQVHSRSWDVNNLQGERHYDPQHAYALSKLCNLLFTFGLVRRLQQQPVRINACHPGVINTKLLRTFYGGSPHMPTRSETLDFLVTSPLAADWNGQYVVNRQPEAPAAVALDQQVQDELWALSERLTGATLAL